MAESGDLSEAEQTARPEPEQYRLHPGQWIGECQILAPIGRGGMGEVYRVRHRSLGKELALKSLAVNDYVLKKRFVAEAKALAKLEHANIVKIYDFFEDQYGHLCYSMELVEGISFSKYLRQRRPLNERFAAFLFRQVFSALDYSHSRGIIHRDIKPSNIMVVKPNSSAPVMRVVDFGLAKLQRDLSMQGLTMEGDVIGSPLYMSPEQCLGQEVDSRSDLYSAGCSLFQALTGTVPFDGDAMSSINLKTSEPAPYMCELAPEIVISDGMEDLVASLLAIDPEKRVQTAAEVCKILYAIECGFPPPVGSLSSARPSGYRRRPVSGRSGSEEQSSASQSSLSVSAGNGVRKQMTMAFMVLAVLFISLTIVGVTAFALMGTRGAVSSRAAAEVKPWAVYAQDDSGRVLDVDLTSPALVRYKQLGNLVLTSAEHYRSFPLLGKFSMPLNAPVMLQIDSDLAYHPELMRGLPGDLLAVIDSVDGVSFNDASVAEIPHFATVRDLRLAGSGLTEKCLPDLNRLLFVQDFSLSSRHISAQALAKLRFLPNLRSIKLRYIQNIDVLLDTLAGCEDLTAIQLDDVVITDETMKKICKLKALHNLELRRMDLNHDLSSLKELPHLRVIDFSESTLTNKCLAQIAQLKHLERFRMGQSYLTTADVAWLKAQLPGVRVDVRPLMSVEKFENGK